MPCCDVTAGHYYSQLMTTAQAATGQQLHGSLSMGIMLDTAQCLETTATVLQMTT